MSMGTWAELYAKPEDVAKLALDLLHMFETNGMSKLLNKSEQKEWDKRVKILNKVAGKKAKAST